jgi:pimeloyl-ACP methyl ester carboxylesterase
MNSVLAPEMTDTDTDADSALSAAAGLAGLRENIFDTGTVKINYAEGPNSGAPLVLLHGLGRNWRDFLVLVPKLSERWHLYAVDLRGHGKSGHVSRGYDSAGYAADVVNLLQAVVREPAVLFGHSNAGETVMQVAARHPELVRAAVLGDTPLSARSLEQSIYPTLFADLHAMLEELTSGSVQEIARGLAKVRIAIPELEDSIMLGDLPGNDEAYLLKWADSLRQVDPDAIQMTLDGSMLAGFDAEALMRRMQCPTLLLRANPEMGGLMSEADMERAMRWLAKPQLAKLRSVGHALFLIHPRPVIEAINSFLESV